MSRQNSLRNLSFIFLTPSAGRSSRIERTHSRMRSSSMASLNDLLKKAYHACLVTPSNPHASLTLRSRDYACASARYLVVDFLTAQALQALYSAMTPLELFTQLCLFPVSLQFLYLPVAAFNLRVGIQYGLLGIREPGSGRGFLCHSFLFVVCAGVARDDMAFVVRHPEPGINAPVTRRSHLLMLDRVPR